MSLANRLHLAWCHWSAPIKQMRVDALLRQRLEPAEYKRRQILCGDPAQFQGDERDVMFLSVVDSTALVAPLPMPSKKDPRIFSRSVLTLRRSRARDQMWIVHSLNHETDLKSGDYRRRPALSTAIDPYAWEREFDLRMAQVDPRSKEV